MIKKLFPGLALAFLSFSAFGQTIVGTTPENKNVILEEFTGIYCGYCPQGHAIAQAIKDNNPDGDVFLINIHTGSFANPNGNDPDFRTPWGAAIAGQTDLQGYPAGTVNRHLFPGQGQGNGTAMSRGQWTPTANSILQESSYVNVAVEADIDVQTNEITIHVEAYYTGNSPESSNLLNVALLQNNTLGPQSGGNAGNNYVHQHRLVEMITGQWGITIPTTTAGTFVDETFTYTIPADYNDITAEIADMEVVAFITETQQEIISGSGTLPTFSGINLANDAFLRDVDEIADTCGNSVVPTIDVQNLGQNEITSLDITYSVNGGPDQVHNWTGSITSLQTETIELPSIDFTLQASNTLDIAIQNDDNNANNEQAVSFDQAVEATSYIDMVLNTDNYGSEVRWNIKNAAGQTMYSGGPYGNNQTINESFALTLDCYTFNLIDTYGDGGGSVTLTDSNNQQIYYTNGNYGSGESASFSTDEELGVTSQELTGVSIYPNPASTTLNVAGAESATVEIYDLLGKLLLTQNNITATESIQISALPTGTYLVKITQDGAVKTDKLVVTK